jgi:hypothetical protein
MCGALEMLASGKLRAPLRRCVHFEIIQRTIGGMYLTILSGTYAVLTSYLAQFRDATQRSANHISLQSSASTSTTGVLRLDPNNSLEGADAIVSFSTLQHAQTLVSSFPNITFHIALKNYSFQRPPASDNIHLSIIPCGLDIERNQSTFVVYKIGRADVGGTEYFSPKITTCGTTAVVSGPVRTSLSSLHPVQHSHRYQYRMNDVDS